jgi:hypothetical protein
MAAGRLVLNGVGQVFLLRGEPGGLETTAIHDPRSRKLDADRFRRITFRMHSDRAAVGAIGYRTCGNCPDGARYFDIQPGWHTYDLDMQGTDDHETFQNVAHSGHGGSAWTGEITLLYLSPAFNEPTKPNLVLEDFSIYEPSPSISVTIGGGSGQTELWWDTNQNQADDGTAAGVGETADRIGTFAAGSTVTISSGLLRAGGSVRFYTSQNGVRSSESAPVTMPRASRPVPVVVAPSEVGGTDWAAAVRHNGWDMNEPSDIETTANIATSMSGGQLHAFGVGHLNDPVVVLDLGAQAIDATIYRKLMITIRFDGPWGLEDAPGGGLVGRIIWRTADGGVQQVSLPMVENTSWSTYVVDLKGTGAIDPAGTPQIIGWGEGAGRFVSQLRFDPHEDPGQRSWHLDEVKLLRNETVSPTFDITFLDRAWAPGTTADLYADADDDPGNGLGTRIASGLAVHQGLNAYRWNGAGVGAGSFTIHTVLHRGGLSTTATSTGQLDVGLNGAGTPPSLGSAPSGPTHEQLVAFFMFILRAKFFCGVARIQNIRSAGQAPICNALLGPWRPRRR